MSEAPVRRRLVEALNKESFVAVTRRFPGDATHSGFVRELDESLVVVEKFHDFYSEGFSLLRQGDIDAIRIRPGDELFAEIIRKENLSCGAPRTSIVLGDGIEGALARVQEHYGLAAIHCETGDPNEDEYVLGEISAIEGDDVLIWVLGPDAQWESDMDVIALGDITQLEFSTPYAETLARHASPSPSGRDYSR